MANVVGCDKCGKIVLESASKHLDITTEINQRMGVPPDRLYYCIDCYNIMIEYNKKNTEEFNRIWKRSK